MALVVEPGLEQRTGLERGIGLGAAREIHGIEGIQSRVSSHSPTSPSTASRSRSAWPL